MTRDELAAHHKKLCDEARELMLRKNHDYANDADVFRNFRAFGRFGILVRLSDKLARLNSFMEKGKLQVINETLHDTLLDITNYCVLFDAYEELP